MKIKLSILILIFVAALPLAFSFGSATAKADELSDNVQEQLGNLDTEDLEEFFDGIANKPEGMDFAGYLGKLIEGKYQLDFGSVFSYLANAFFGKVFETIPTFIFIIAIAIFCGIMQSVRSSFLSEGTCNVIFFVCFLSVILVLSVQMASMWNDTRNVIENIAKLTEIVSPILLVLMVASGANVSAGVYRPAVAFLSGGVIGIFTSIIIPLVGFFTIFNVLSNFSENIKLTKFSEFISGVIKWVLGIVVTVFGIFLTVQGITGASYDGISIKAAKYAISNSVPIIGGFLKDGFDLVVAGSVIIKNTVGIIAVVAIFYTVFSPVLSMAAFSLLLKLTAALIEPISDPRLSNFCTSMAKSITYFTVSLLAVGFMLFITVLLIIFSANAFI